jgi:hypothetical protein
MLKWSLNAIVNALLNADDACNMGMTPGDTKEHLNEVSQHYPDGKHAFYKTRYNKDDVRAALAEDGMPVSAHARPYHNHARHPSFSNV